MSELIQQNAQTVVTRPPRTRRGTRRGARPPSPGAVGPGGIAIVDDHSLFAEALEVALATEHREVHRVALPDHPASTGHLVTTVLRTDPRLVLLDLDLGAAGDGSRLVEPLSEASVAVVVITGSTERARWGESVLHGARTVLPKTTPLSTILTTIRRVDDDLPVLDEHVREAWLASYHQESGQARARRDRLESLTSREGEVLAHLMAGRGVRDIAEQSCVAESTVRTHVKSILAKLDVSSQVAAVGAAYKAKWRPPVLPMVDDLADMSDAVRVRHP
jgi:DNA-binding NarL/FixJ family response regulator